MRSATHHEQLSTIQKTALNFRHDNLAYSQSTHIKMFKNHLKTAIRTLLRDRVYSGINVLSLTIGITVCLLVLLFVVYENDFDKQYDQNIHRLGVEQTENGTQQRIAKTMFPVGRTLKNEFPAT